MLALINTASYEEVMEDLNNIIFNVIEPKSLASLYYDELEDIAIGGATEEYLYNELSLMTQEANKRK